MNTIRRALGNSAILIASQMATWTTTIILTAALGRSLGASGFGDLYLTLSFGLIFSVIIEFGLDQQMVRAVARDPDQASSYLVNSVAIKGVLSVIAYLTILVAVRLLHYGPELRLAIEVYCPILLLNGLTASLTAIYKAREAVLFPALGTILEKSFNCVVALILLAQGAGIVTMSAVFVGGAAVNVALQAAFLRRVVSLERTLAWSRIVALVKGALPFLLYWVLGAIYYRIDIVLLAKLTDNDTVGWYGAAYRLFDTLNFLPMIVSGVIMFPILSRLSQQSPADLRLAMEKALGVLLVIGIPICVGLFVLAEPIIALLYGSGEFDRAVPALRWLAVGLLFLYINSIFAYAFVSINQERRMTLVAALATVLNLGANVALIPRYGHVGAAAATAATECFILGYLLVRLPRELLPVGGLVVFAKAALAAVAMALVLHLLRGWNLALVIPVGGSVYALGGFLLRVVPPEDIALVRAAVGKKRGGTVASQRAA
jgi:O-antigen/teichoic acid export membrane protein